MDKYIVLTNTPTSYHIEAKRFEIMSQVLYFYNNNDDIFWVIKDWTAFQREVVGDEQKAANPDEFYENIDKQEP
jgi:hypothetical protein